jgi:hypothetical protein
MTVHVCYITTCVLHAILTQQYISRSHSCTLHSHRTARFFRFLARLAIRSWTWWLYVPPKRRAPSELHTMTAQKSPLHM